MSLAFDPRTLGWLQRALTHEMRALQQYLAQSVLAQLWGEGERAAAFRREAEEELEHAARLMEELIRLGAAPNAAAIPPARLGRSIPELLAADLMLEKEAVLLYEGALAHAQRQRNERMMRLFSELLSAETKHARQLAQQLQETRDVAED
ncbi:MAG: ferritin-like domain-containing protein [Rhodocyclaceae bacterium]|nr:ferritin-like domain-containing protein [Rhodocyclaceae bacterium]